MSSASVSPARIDARSTAGRPKLLVSVRSIEEARAAIDGGADIVDVKEPRRGSLGRADPEVIAAVAETVRSMAPELPVSAALGELRDCESQFPRITDEMDFVKLGLAGASDAADWPERWGAVRHAIERQWYRPVPWVGVAYADAINAGAPPVDEVIAAAANAGCAGLLIDTCGKSTGGLLSFADQGELLRWAHQIHDAGMFMALAGRITVAELAELSELRADVIAVRSAVCRASQRNAELASELVASFRRALQQAFRSRNRSRFR